LEGESWERFCHAGMTARGKKPQILPSRRLWRRVANQCVGRVASGTFPVPKIPTIAANLAVVLWLGLFFLPPVHGQRKREKSEALPPAPPPPVAKTVTVRPGETVQVPLGIHGSRARQVAFLIRSQPKSGKLSAVQNTGLNSAVVQYTAGREPGADRFTYAVRTEEGVSAPVAVAITIMVAPALPPRLIAPEALEFPAVMVGAQSTAVLELSNEGGGMAEGEVSLPEGWRMEGALHYQLGAGKQAKFKLIFAPDRAGDFAGEAILGPVPRRVVTLRGTAKAPLEIAPAALELTAPKDSRMRAATLRIENRSTEPRQVILTASPRVMVDRTVTIPAGAGLDVPVLVAAEDPAALEEKLRLESPAWTAEVPLRAAALPAVIKFKGAAPDFGTVPLGQKAEATAELENSGGMPAIVRVSVGAPFEVSAAGVEVPARGSVKIPVAVRGHKAGSYSSELVVESGVKIERLPLNVVITGMPEPVRRAPPSRPPEPKNAEAEAGPSPPSPPPLQFSPLADMPGPLGKFTRDVTPHSVVLEWPSSLGSGAALAVQERIVAAGLDGMPVITWKPFGSARISEANGVRRAELSKLEPDRFYVFRVTSGNESVFTTKFVTPPVKPWIDVGWRGFLIAVLLLGLAGVAWRQWKTRVRSGW
jgi:hypothetical protein